jgi:hypothetical protein
VGICGNTWDDGHAGLRVFKLLNEEEPTVGMQEETKCKSKVFEPPHLTRWSRPSRPKGRFSGKFCWVESSHKSSHGVKRRAAAIRAAEAATEARIANIVSAPHKCARSGCDTMIAASEEICPACRNAQIGTLPPLKKRPVYTKQCLSCEALAVRGENYCYDHLGD